MEKETDTVNFWKKKIIMVQNGWGGVDLDNGYVELRILVEIQNGVIPGEGGVGFGVLGKSSTFLFRNPQLPIQRTSVLLYNQDLGLFVP